jgi:hypothetical protein
LGPGVREGREKRKKRGGGEKEKGHHGFKVACLRGKSEKL